MDQVKSIFAKVTFSILPSHHLHSLFALFIDAMYRSVGFEDSDGLLDASS